MTITTQQARQRFTTIPSRLQDAIFSEQTAEIMDNITQQYHLDDEKAGVVIKLTGRVLLGFIHSEDLPKEIQTELNLPAAAAAEISKSLDTKIFAALRDDLMAAYAPAPSSEQEISPIISSAPGPKILSESFSAKPNIASVVPPRPMPAPVVPQPAKPQIISQSGSGIGVKTTPLSSNRTVSPSPAPQPTPIKPPSGAGWSKQASQEPVVKLGAITPTKPTPPAPPISITPNAQPAKPAAAAQPQPTTPKSMGEFERIDAMKKGGAPLVPPKPASAPAPTPAAPVPTVPKTTAPTPPTPPMPGPVMLHEVSVSSPLSKAPDIRYTTSMRDQMAAKPSQAPLPPKAAVIELGGSAPKVVHYSEYTSSTPMPTPPKPPTPNKVLVKDFLEPQK